MKHYLFFLSFFFIYLVSGQSTLTFFSEEGTVDAEYFDDHEITFWILTGDFYTVSGALQIISDSSVMVGTDTIAISTITAHKRQGGQKVKSGAVIMGAGALMTTFGFVRIYQINNTASNTAGELVASIGSSFAAVMVIAGGVIVTTVGTVITLVNLTRKQKVSNKPPKVALN